MSSLKKLLQSLIDGIQTTPVKYQTINKTIITNNIFVNGLGAENSTKNLTISKTVDVTTVVEKIREKRKEHSKKMNKNKRKIRPKRMRRSVDETVPNLASNGNLKNSETDAFSSDGFYRHPKLSYEEQRKNLRDVETTTNESSTPIGKLEMSTKFYNRAWNTVNVTHPRFKIVVPPTGAEERTQGNQDSSDAVHLQALRIRETDGNESASGFESLNDAATESLNESAIANGNKENSGNGYESTVADRKTERSMDAAGREDSSDVKDAATDGSEKSSGARQGSILADQPLTASGTEYRSTDRIPIIIESGKKLSQYEVEEPQDRVSLKEEDREGSELTTASEIPYNPKNIPYVEVPDYSDVREESLDKERYEAVDDTDSDAVDPDDDHENGDSIGAYLQKGENREGSDLDSLKETQEEKSSGAFGGPSNSEPLIVTKESELHEDKRTDNENEERKVKQEDAVAFEPVAFDINEYTKPFNLDEFMKNDPIFRKLAPFKNPVNDESKSIPEYKDYAEKETESTESKNDSKPWPSLSPVFDFSEAKEDPAKHQSSDVKQDYPEYAFKQIVKPTTSSPFGKEDEFLSQYFSKDIIRKLQSDEEDHQDSRKRDEQGDKVYETLSAILDKKDKISRLNDEVAKSSDDEKPRNYKNFWFLEYSSPQRENLEEKKEEQ